MTSLPMIENAVFARYLLQPTESLDNGLAMEALVFPAYPIGKHHVQVVHHFDKIGLAKLVVVIVPTSHLALNLYCYLLEFSVQIRMQLPLLHLLMQLLHRFLADGRKKVCEALALLSIQRQMVIALLVARTVRH